MLGVELSTILTVTGAACVWFTLLVLSSEVVRLGADLLGATDTKAQMLSGGYTLLYVGLSFIAIGMML